MMLLPDKDISVREVVHPCLPKWRARVDAARQRGRFTRKDREASEDWHQCAVGEAAGQGYCSLDGDVYGLPRSALQVLGIQFDIAVHRNHFDEAEQIVGKIEKELLCLTRPSI